MILNWSSSTSHCWDVASIPHFYDARFWAQGLIMLHKHSIKRSRALVLVWVCYCLQGFLLLFCFALLCFEVFVNTPLGLYRVTHAYNSSTLTWNRCRRCASSRPIWVTELRPVLKRKQQNKAENCPEELPLSKWELLLYHILVSAWIYSSECLNIGFALLNNYLMLNSLIQHLHVTVL